jgi:hypothetical protein
MRTILIILTIYLALRVLFKYILPTFLNMTLLRMAEQLKQQQTNNNSFNQSNHIPANQSPTNNKYSDAIDVEYEEIK